MKEDSLIMKKLKRAYEMRKHEYWCGPLISMNVVVRWVSGTGGKDQYIREEQKLDGPFKHGEELHCVMVKCNHRGGKWCMNLNHPNRMEACPGYGLIFYLADQFSPNGSARCGYCATVISVPKEDLAVFRFEHGEKITLYTEDKL